MAPLAVTNGSNTSSTEMHQRHMAPMNRRGVIQPPPDLGADEKKTLLDVEEGANPQGHEEEPISGGSLPLITSESKENVGEETSSGSSSTGRCGSWFSSMAESCSNIRVVDMALAATYLCASIAITTPVILLPVIAMDPSKLEHGVVNFDGGPDALVASIAALSTLGGAVGKIVNPFVCQALGPRNSASLYLGGLAAFAIFLSSTSTMHGTAIAGFEFCFSIMWTALPVVLASHYEHDAARFGTGVMMLSLSSTFGQLLTKVVGASLLNVLHWRDVAKISALISLSGVLVVHSLVRDHPEPTANGQNNDESTSTSSTAAKEKLTLASAYNAVQNVVGTSLFWKVGLSHAMSYLARNCDKILGAFYQQATGLPSHISGGLTSSVTIGFVHGLVTGRKFDSMQSVAEKRRFLNKRYENAVLSALALSVCANGQVASALGTVAVTLLVSLASFMMASSMSFQFYQLTPLVSKTFGKNIAICISFLDGVGFFVSAPIWAAVSHVIGNNNTHGWSVAWIMLAGWFGVGGVLMSNALPSFIKDQGSSSTSAPSKKKSNIEMVLDQ